MKREYMFVYPIGQLQDANFLEFRKNKVSLWWKESFSSSNASNNWEMSR